MLMLKNNYVFILFDCIFILFNCIFLLFNCIFILFNFCPTLISWLSSRLIGSIVTEMSDTEKMQNQKRLSCVCVSGFVEMGT